MRCYIQPKASRDGIIGLHNGELKVRLTAPPVDGAANQCLIKFFAKQFGIAKTQIKILSGQSSRHKLLLLDSPSIIPTAAKISTIAD
ncbi:MAG: DUF167 family protein [Porticoccaceae bacterium]|nr:DUF167 family protein [Porticoccaceae bacterium]